MAQNLDESLTADDIAGREAVRGREDADLLCQLSYNFESPLLTSSKARTVQATRHWIREGFRLR